MSRIGRVGAGAILTAWAAACGTASGGTAGGGFGGSGAGSGTSGTSGGGGLGGGAGGGGGLGALGGSGGTGGVLFPDGGGATAGTGGAACAAETRDGERIPLDMYIVFDRSGSMAGTLWDETKQAFLDFAAAPESDGVGVGLSFYPPGSSSGANCALPPCPPGCIPFLFACVPANLNEGCDVNDYLPPVVFIEPLPAVRSKLEAALNGTSPAGGTPTQPALEAARNAVTAYAAQHPDRKVIIVLATDGNPNDCNSTNAGVASIAASSHSQGVDVFVIAIAQSGVDVAGLDTVAQSGGTGQALVVQPGSAGTEFQAAMDAIRGSALGCQFKLPAPPTGEELDPQKVNVFFTPPGGTRQGLYFVSSESGCDPVSGGWYYSDPSNPLAGEILICPANCDELNDAGGKVDIEVGCATTVPS